ncbi:aminotransferase [Streptomyces alkaliphilus]|uniref:Aminotransferase n=1 Tax=Streptomyces alkaliphilus TaxID=1472722 RepID=A0A7W3TDJ9_9ACTN|nr:glycogen debranching N-terminal domain-containing protein [Streptomyces alkaliphilus]MBB0244793.1 aminotransferase [Streptomyces alkaliphilus]
MTVTHHRLLVHNGTFALLGPSGDITGARGALPDGLFTRDARHLSRWQLTVDGTTPTVLVPTTGGSGETASCVLAPPGGRGEPPAVTVFREQTVTAGTLVERIRLVSNRATSGRTMVALTVDADFADQFELRSDHRWYDKPHAVRSRETLPDGVAFGYRRREWHSRTVVSAEPAPDAVEDTGSGARRLVWLLESAPRGSAELVLRVAAHPHGAPGPATGSDDFPAAGTLPSAGPGMGSLDRACARGVADLAALRIPAEGPDGTIHRVPAAGVPWFLTLMGRHALFTSLLALPHLPQPAAATLPALAATRATQEDPARIAQPGKIVHEVRHGELAHFGQVPYARYYGAVDSTPLFLVLLDEHARVTGDTGPARALEGDARAAVEWMFRHGGLDGYGYLVYHPDEGGLANQSWKDSPDAICFADGTPARGAITSAAAQGYAWDALRRTAGLARRVWGDPGWAERLESAARDLRERFLADFWMPEHDFPALALDGTGRRVDALASDAGHLLWSGILDAERAVAVGRRLLEPDFFSGWGVRTLAAGQDAYHPLAYHRGGVWPHDNAVLALGLARYGLRAEGDRLLSGLMALAERHHHRLPEVVAGYGREECPEPVPYPYACSPQAWAAAAPLALLTARRAAEGGDGVAADSSENGAGDTSGNAAGQSGERLAGNPVPESAAAG